MKMADLISQWNALDARMSELEDRICAAPIRHNEDAQERWDFLVRIGRIKPLETAA